MNSKFLNLQINDLWKGLIVAVATALLTGIYNGIESGTIAFTWIWFKPIVLSSVGAGIAYILKNMLTNSEGKILKGEPKNETENIESNK